VRVGLVSPYSLTIPGGVQGQVLALARALRAEGVAARVLGPCDGPPPDADVTPLGKSIPTAANGSVAPLAPDPAAQLRTLRALWDEDFDVIHLHEPMTPGPTQTTLLLRPAPIVATFHAAGTSASYQYLDRPLRWLAGRIDRRCAVSEDALALVREPLGGEYTIVHNAVEVDRYRAAEPWPTEGPTVFFVGRHEPRKGLAVLLDALAGLPADVRLWVGSDGPETTELKARTAGDPRIEWLGRISEEEKLSRLAGADLFCAPSLRGESFGVVLLEAMAAETPIVASDLHGYAKVARAGRDAVLVEPGDVGALATAIEKVLHDRDEAHRLVEAGRARAEEFSMARQAARYLEIYDETIAAARPGGAGRDGRAG
jgi:phosphatidylinositol alpha-mannosyltransferase